MPTGMKCLGSVAAVPSNFLATSRLSQKRSDHDTGACEKVIARWTGSWGDRASEGGPIVDDVFWCVGKKRDAAVEGSRRSCGGRVSLGALSPVMDFGK